MQEARRGDLVQIHRVILEPVERPDNLPDSTKSVPYECWVKGFLLDEGASKGDRVRIKTFIGRELTGKLYEINPRYEHNFGTPQKEILPIGNEVRRHLKERE